MRICKISRYKGDVLHFSLSAMDNTNIINQQRRPKFLQIDNCLTKIQNKEIKNLKYIRVNIIGF